MKMQNGWSDYLQLVRAPAVFTALSNILAAQLIVGQGVVQWFSLLILFAASAALYMSGMVLNDYFDYAEDKRQRPARPLPSGRIGLATARSLGSALMILGILLSAMVGQLQFIIAILLALAILGYDGYAKNTIAGSIVMGSCRYLNWLLGLSVIGLNYTDLVLPLPVLIYVTSLTILSKVETTANDRSAVIVSALGMSACAGVILIIHQSTPATNNWPLILLAAAIVFVLLRLRSTFKEFSPQQIQQTMKLLILGIIPLDALLTLLFTPWWGGAVVLSLLIPGWLLAKSIHVT